MNKILCILTAFVLTSCVNAQVFQKETQYQKSLGDSSETIAAGGNNYNNMVGYIFPNAGLLGTFLVYNDTVLPKRYSFPEYDSALHQWFPRVLTGGISVNDTGYVTVLGGIDTLNGDVTGASNANTVKKWFGSPLNPVDFGMPGDAQFPIYENSGAQWHLVLMTGDASMTDAGAVTVSKWEGMSLNASGGGSFAAPPANAIPLWDTGGGTNKWYARQLTGAISINDTGFVTITSGTVTLNGDVTGTAAHDTVVGIMNAPINRAILPLSGNTAGILYYNSSLGAWTLSSGNPSNNQIPFWNNGGGVIQWESPSSLGFVSSVTATAPLASSGGTTPNISITAATNAGILIDSQAVKWKEFALSGDVSMTNAGVVTVTGIETKPVNTPTHTATVATYNNATGHIEWDSVTITGLTAIYSHAVPVQIFGGDSVAVNLVSGNGIAITSGATADTISAFLNQIRLSGDVRGAANANKAFQFHGDTNSITANVTLNDSSATCWNRRDNTASSDTVFLPSIGAWGKLLTFEKGDTAVSATVIKAAATNYLGGVLNGALSLSKQFDHLTIISADPKNWVVISQVIGGAYPSSPPTGAAGGDLAGTYPNPAYANTSIAGTDAWKAIVTSGNIWGVPSGGTDLNTVPAHDLMTGNGTLSFDTIKTGSVGQVLTSNGTALDPSFQTRGTGRAIYGDSSDGTVLMDGTNTFAAFASLVGSTYTLTRDIYCRKLVIYSTVTLKTASFRISASDTLIDSNAIVNVGGNAAGSTAGAGATAGTLGGGKNGGTGVTTNVNGNSGTAANPSEGNSGGAGGNCTNTGGAGGISTAPPNNTFNVIHTIQFPDGFMVTTTGTWSPLLGGAGGGSGASAGAGTSGGGGGGGGQISIYARVIRLVGAGFINVDGGNGANGTGTNAGGGGGGGGGWVKIVSDDCTPLVNNTNIFVGGGANGNGIGTGSNGVAGSNGNFTFIQN